MKKFLKRFTKQVNENYIFSLAEIQQNLRILNLFETFDSDGSGALDSDELVDLYQQNGIIIGTEEIAKLYGNPDVKFTLDEFKTVT